MSAHTQDSSANSKRGIWYSVAELAGLPGLPGTGRGLVKFAEAQGWHDDKAKSRQRRGRGGGREYRSEILPEQTQNYLARRVLRLAEPAAPVMVDAMPPDFPAGRKAQARQEAALIILAAWDRHRPATTGGLGAAREAFCTLYEGKQIDLAPWVRDARPSLTPATLKSWEGRRAQATMGGEWADLGGRYGNRKGSSAIDSDPEIHQLVLGLIADRPHIKGKAVLRALRARFEDGRPLPSLRAVQRWMAAWKADNAQVYLAVSNPDKWRSKFKSAAGTKSAGIERLNQVWEMDSTPTDVMLSDGRRHAIVGVIDVYSRRLKFLVAPTSRATAVAALLRRALLAWGVPETLKTDNGSDYVSRHIARVMAGLEILQDVCPPFTPEAKPHIERAFKTFSHDIVELLPGYIGHDVAGRKDIEARRSFAERFGNYGGGNEILGLTPEQLQDVCDTWCDGLYAREGHGGLGGRSPFEVASAWPHTVRRIENERALDILLAEAPDNKGWRVVGKRGIAVQGRHYMAGPLGGLIGARVSVRFDESDVGLVFVFDADGGFLCQAECPEITGVSREEVAARMTAHQKAKLAEAKTVLRQAKKTARPGDIAEEILAKASRDAGRVVALTRSGSNYETPGLAAAADAAAGPEIVGALTPEQLAKANEMWARLQTRPPAAGHMAPPAGTVVGFPIPQNDGAAGGRPAFPNDRAMGEWLIANQDEMDGDDRAWLIERLGQINFRLWLDLDEETAASLVRNLRDIADHVLEV